MDKPKSAPINPETTPKKSNEGVPGPGPQMGPLGGYGMYPMYPNLSPYGYPPDHPAAAAVAAAKGMPPSQSPGNSGPLRPDGKEPPLDLISKPGNLPCGGDPIGPPPPGSNKDPSPNIPPQQQQQQQQPQQGKGMPHYFPYK